MSHIPSNIETKIPKSFSSNYLNFSTPYDVLTSPRHSDLFSKTKSSHRPNTNGQPSVVLYRKTDKLPHKFDLPFKESGYITDGGIHKKKQRYINSQSPKHTFTSSNTKIKPLMCSKSMRSVKKQPNTHLILMTTCPSVNNISSHNKIFTSISSGMNNKHYVTSPKVKTTSVISSSSNKKLTLSPSNQSNSVKHGGSAKTKMNKKHNSSNSNTHTHTHSNSNKHHPQIQTYRGLKLSSLSPSSSHHQYENEEHKNDKKNLLIQRDIQQLIRDTQPTNNNERLRKEIDRKTLILNDNGVYIKNIEQILKGETPSQSECSRLSVETISNTSKQQQRPTIKQIHLKNKTHNKYITHTNTNTTRPMLSSPSRQVLKPKIDNFEFCHQIHLHQKIKAKSKKQKSNHKISINSSFRECISKPHISGTTSSLIDSKVREVRDSENEYLFSHKKVYKSQENIQKYIKTKRKKELILEENKIQQKNKRILNNYKELYNIGNMRRLMPSKKKKVKHTKHKQHYKYKYMCSNVNLSTIIDEDKLKDEVFKVQNIIYKDDDDIILSSGTTNTNGVIAHNSNNVLSHSNSNTTTGSEQQQQEEMVHGGNNNNNNKNMKNLIKKVKNTIKQNEIVNNKAMMNQLLLNSHETTSDENEQLNEEDLLTSNNNINNNDKQHKHTLHSKSEKTPRSITTSNNVYTNNHIYNTTKHHNTNPTTSKHSSKPNNNNNINKYTTSDVAITKDKNIPSLSHSYTNTNNNQHIDMGIEPRCVLNLVEILKILTQRKVFFFLYELYLNEITIYRYNIAFSYFIAIIKQNAFLAIEEYGTYKTDYNAFIKLFTPFLRQHFTFFVNQCHYRRKVEHLVATLLKRMKLTFLERIYFYGYARVSRNNIIKGICKALTRPYLVSAFETFVYNVNIVNTCSNVNVSGNNYSSGNYSELYYMSFNKNKTYVYESFSSESYSIDPNSEDSPKLHTLFRMVESLAQRRGEEFDGEIDLSVLKENAKERVWKNAAKMKKSESGSGSGKKGEKERSGRFSKDKEMQIEINIEPDIDVYKNNGSGGKQQFSLEQDISVDKEHSNSNIDWVLNVPSESKSKDNTGNNSINSNSNNNTNEKPKLKIITEPHKESLFPTTKQIANNSNSNTTKPKNTSDLIIEELPYDNILSPPPSQPKQQTPPHTNNNNTTTTNIIDSPSSLFTNINLSSLTDIITTELLTTLLSQEITNTKQIIPHKRFNPLPNPNNSLQLSQSGSLTSSSLNNLTPSDKLTSSPKSISTTNIAYINPLTDNTLLAAYSSSSVFNRSIKEKKKEQSLTFYTTYIAPHLISLIKHEIITNYDNILSNISSPLKTNPHELITALVLEDADLLRNNYRLSQTTTTISDILNKQHLLTKFAPINIAIRQQSSHKPQITSTEQARDDMLNSCIIDAAIELINKERKYGDAGEPLPWSSRMRDIQFKYDKAHPHKLAAFIERKLYEMLNDKIGMINDNYEYLSQEQVNVEREGKLIETIKGELKESEAQWANLEIQETQIKLEITDMILDQLYNEVVEILEHIQFNRKRPDLYQFKSIYACEEIPRLSFQITTTGEENENEDDNDIINMEEQLH